MVQANELSVQLIDAILADPNVLRKLDSREFEVVIARVLARVGWEGVKLTPRSKDGGFDVSGFVGGVAIRIPVILDCKQYKNTVKVTAVRTMLGTLEQHHNKAATGVIVTTAKFSRGATDLMRDFVKVQGKAFDDVCQWLDEARKR